MARTSPLFRFVTLTFGASLLAPSAWAGPKVDPLAPTRAKLDALEACLGKSETLATLRKGLMWGWQKPGSPPPPETPQPPPPPHHHPEKPGRGVRRRHGGAPPPR